MKKNEFIALLAGKLSGLPQDDVERSLAYYSGYIDDAVEDGVSEEEAVAALGTPDAVAEAILSETSFLKLVKNKLRPRRAMQAWEILLLVLCAPILLSLAAAALAVVVALYAVLWSLCVVVFAVAAATGAGAIGLLFASGVQLATGEPAAGVLCIGVALLCAGLAILSFYATRYTVRGMVFVSKKIALGIKSLFVRKEKKA